MSGKKVVLALAVLAGFVLAGASAKDLLFPNMTPEKGSFEKPAGVLAEKPKAEWSQTTVAAGVNNKPLEGKLAFLFPGEGAQYPNMLHDLCLNFPEVRQCFDTADRAKLRASVNILPSEFIFPRSILAVAEKSEVERAVWGLEGAVSAVLIGN